MSNQLKETISIEDVISLLNEAVATDAEAMQNLINQRVSCNKELAAHPTIQVMANKEGTEYKVGIVGLLNGMFGTAPDGYGAIAAMFDDDKKLTGFKRIR